MAITVDELKILINAETAGLRRELKKVNSSLGKTEKRVGKVGLGFGRLVKIMGVLGLARVAGQVVQTSRTFEDLEATLRAITGSAEAAGVSMDLVRKFTSGTTFQLENVSQAFITLLNAGITPTSDVLKDFGNIAAAFNKDITQIAQATFNATTGEMEMLKQFGIKAKLEGDKITMIFREQETTIGRSSSEIVSYLRNIAQENFATALEERLSTVSGAFSNLGDVVSEIFNAIGEGGLNEILVESGLKLIDWGNKGQDAARVFGELLKIAFDKLKIAIQFVTNNMRQLLAVVTIFMAVQLGTFVINTAIAFNSLRKQIGLTKIAMLAFNKVSKGNIIMMLGVAVLALTGGLEKLGEKVEEMVGIIGDKLGGALNDGEEGADELTDSIEELNAELERIAGNLTDDIPSSTSATGDAFGDMRNAVIESSSAFTKDFADSLINAENALDAFKNFAKNIVSQIIAIFLQMAIVNKILNHVFGLTGTTDALPTMFNAPAAAVATPTASGGTVQAGMPALVGERGAEIFVPNTSGKVLNNMNSNNALGGGGGIVINQSLNFSTGIVPTVRTEIIKMLPQIAEITKASVFDAATRGGQYGKALRGTI